MDDKEKYLSQMLNKERTPEQAQACYLMVQQKIEQQKKKKAVIRRRVLACVASLIVICAAVLIPLFLKKEETRYYDDNLILVQSTKADVDAGFEDLNIEVPIFDSSAVLSYQAYKVKDQNVFVGSKFIIECLTDTNYYDCVVMLYDNSVVLDLTNYDGMVQTIEFDGITYKYELTSMEDDMFNYQAYAVTDDFTIIIKYRAFFDEFATFIDQLY